MMNLNPLFFDKSLLLENKNILNSSNNSKQTYLFSDIIKICEDGIDNISNADHLQKEILLDVNELKNLSITKSNEETVKGIQQTIEFLENCALVSNSDTFNINSSHISSKVFILNKENLIEFFNKINETLQKKSDSEFTDVSDSKIIYLEEKEKNNKNNSEFNFVSFNPNAIIKAVDSNDVFNVALKAKGEKLTLTISKAADDHNNVNSEKEALVKEAEQKISYKIKEQKQPEIFFVDRTLKDVNMVSNNDYINNDAPRQYEYNVIDNDKSYYKLEVVYISIDDNNFIYTPAEKTETSNSISPKNISYNFTNPDTQNNQKIAGIINPVSKDNINVKHGELVSNQYNGELKYLESTPKYSIKKQDITQNTKKAEENISIELLEKNSQIDFNLLTGGKFTKSKIIKNVSEKEIAEFLPEVIDRNNTSEITELKKDINKKLIELNTEQIKVEPGKKELNFVAKAADKLNPLVNLTENLKDEINKETNDQFFKTDKNNEELINSFSRINLKSFFNQERKNEITGEKKQDEFTASKINENKAGEKITIENKVNEIVPSSKETDLENTIDKLQNNHNDKVKAETNNSVNQNLDYKETFEKKKENNKEILIKDNGKDFISNLHDQKELLKATQFSNSGNEQKFDSHESKLNLTPNKPQNLSSLPFDDVHHLKDSIQIINKNQILEEISNYINNGNKQSITFQLSPENLGKLTLSIDFVENKLNAKIEVENDQIKQFIQSNIEQLKNSLQSSGIQLNDVNVSLGNYEQRSLRNTNQKKKSYSKTSYSKEINVDNSKASSSKKMLGYNTYDFLI